MTKNRHIRTKCVLFYIGGGVNLFFCPFSHNPSMYILSLRIFIYCMRSFSCHIKLDIYHYMVLYTQNCVFLSASTFGACVRQIFFFKACFKGGLRFCVLIPFFGPCCQLY